VAAPGVLAWLLDSDPAIRWQVMRDLIDADASTVKVERARVAREGWGSRLLDLQAGDGNWGGGPYSPKWTSTMYTLLLLRHLGVDPADERVRKAIDLVGERVSLGSKPFFLYSAEMCMTGMALALGSYFLDRPIDLPQPALALERQKRDGGWNCRVGSERSSFHTTISVLEGILEYEKAMGADAALSEARHRAHEYLLERRLMYSMTTGELINERWLLMSFPPRWFYDVMRALDYLQDAAVAADPRWEVAIEAILSKRRKDGTWPLQNRHAGRVHFDMEEGSGKPSRWNTLRALRVLRWQGSTEEVI
jgi:hypothetical protein